MCVREGGGTIGGMSTLGSEYVHGMGGMTTSRCENVSGGGKGDIFTLGFEYVCCMGAMFTLLFCMFVV